VGLFVWKGVWVNNFVPKTNIDDKELLLDFIIDVITRLYKTQDKLGKLIDAPNKVYILDLGFMAIKTRRQLAVDVELSLRDKVLVFNIER
jgi:hypothetical protein